MRGFPSLHPRIAAFTCHLMELAMSYTEGLKKRRPPTRRMGELYKRVSEL